MHAHNARHGVPGKESRGQCDEMRERDVRMSVCRLENRVLTPRGREGEID